MLTRANLTHPKTKAAIAKATIGAAVHRTAFALKANGEPFIQVHYGECESVFYYYDMDGFSLSVEVNDALGYDTMYWLETLADALNSRSIEKHWR